MSADAGRAEGLMDRLARLSPEKRALLVEMLHKPRASLPRSGDGREGPLSFAQERLFFLERLRPGGAAYNIAIALRLRGPLDRATVAAAFRDVVAQNDALRTIIADGGPDGAGPVQRVTDAAPAWHEEDAASEAAALARAHEAARRPFDPSREPMARAELLRIAPEDHLFVFVTHHLVADGSLGIILAELAEAYLARKSCAPGAAPPSIGGRGRFVDFCRWQRDTLHGDRLERRVAYWRDALAGHPGALLLPLERPRPPRQSFRGARLQFRLDARVAEGLRGVAARRGATLFTVGLAVFTALLHRWSGQDDFVVGTPIADRPFGSLERTVGSFVNVLPIRLGAAGDTTFEELVDGARTAVLGAFEHKDVPLELIVDAVRPPRDLSRMPLFQSMFVVQERAPSAALFPGVEAEVVELDAGTSRFDLLIALREEAGQGGGIAGILEYDTALFDAADAERIARRFERLARSAAGDPELPLSRLAMLGDDERAHWMTGWNGPVAEAPAGLLHGPFEEQARRRPDAIAVEAPHRTLRYGELARWARAIGDALRRRGVGKDELVAIVMEKGWEQIVAALGVLTSGGAYLPLDPALPRERIATILAHAKVRIALTQPWIDDALAWPDGVERLRVDGDAPDSSADDPAQPAADPDDLAYVIYTSGSTGAPKGVMIEHRAALNTVLDVNARFAWTAEDRVLALSSLGFDLSVQDVFGTLGAGGTIVVPEAARAREPSHWLDLVARHGVTVWNSAPALFQMAVEHAAAPAPSDRAGFGPALRLAMLSGDWIPVALPDAARALAPGLDVVSLGGATEASIWSIFHRVDRVDPAWTSIPYGRPLTNQTIYVLDRELEPCPLGLTGEIYIGGAGLARGYLHDEEKTRRSFIVHPRTGERLYRTFDLGRQRRGGFVEFLGRSDFQVKIRGYRVELGEIEATLAAHPDVRDVVVAAHGDRTEKQLVAYVVPNGGAIDEAALRALVRAKLPEYMEPSAFVELGALPLSSNGKVDRAALPAPARAASSEAAFVAPRGEVEAAIARIFGEVLGAPRVSATDDFFSLGGTSFSAVRLAARVRRELDVELPLATLFENPTVRRVAEAIGARGDRPAAARPALVTLRAGGEGDPVFFVHPAGGSVFAYRGLAERLGRPFHAIQAPLHDDLAPPATIGAIARAYAALVRPSLRGRPFVLGGWSVGGVIAAEMAAVLAESGAPPAHLVLLDAHARPGAIDADAERALLAVDLARMLDADVDPRDIDDAEALARIVRASGRFGGDVDAAFARRLAGVFLANVRAAAAHEPRPYDGRVVLVRAAESPAQGASGDLGWGAAFARACVTALTAPGDHYTMLSTAHVGSLAARIAEALKSAAPEAA